MKKIVCLIIHGFAGGVNEIEYLAKNLENRGLDVHTVSLAGHGGTKKELRKYSFQDWIDSVENAISNLKQEYKSINLVGFSMGGLICTYFEACSEINSIVFINTPIYFWNVKIIMSDVLSGIRRRKFDKIAYYIESALGVSIKSSLDFLQILHKSKKLFLPITKQCLVIQCLNDEIVRYKSAQYIKDKIGSSAQLIYYKGGCHQIFIKSPELRDQMCEAIYQFLGSSTVKVEPSSHLL